MVEIVEVPLPGLLVLQLSVHGDERGFFVERFNARDFESLGLPVAWLQDNHSRSAPGVLRGLHYQFDPPQGKLVGVTRGRLWDVAVDVRPDSRTFGKWHAVELTDTNGKLLWIPPGFAHGFCVLGDEPVDMLYKVTTLYDARGESGVRFDDPELAIPWPIPVGRATLSKRDLGLPSLAEYRKDPPRWKTVSRDDR